MSLDRDIVPTTGEAAAVPFWDAEAAVAAVAARWAAWQQRLEQGDEAQADAARTEVADAIGQLLQAIGLAGAAWPWPASLADTATGREQPVHESGNAVPEPTTVAAGSHHRSMASALQALTALLLDPQASLPASLATALVLTHDRQADLRLRQLLAERDPAWAQSVLVADAGAPDRASPVLSEPAAVVEPKTVESLQASHQGPLPSTPKADDAGGDTPSFARDWWSVPIEGLSGSNQLFLLETRELLRSAELSLQVLGREPGDYAEQMVLCRSFQAVAVAAASMGLHRLAALAGEGERLFDQVLEQGGTAGQEALAQTDALLERLYADLLDLVGEPPPQPQPQAPAEPSADEVTSAPAPPESEQAAPPPTQLPPGPPATEPQPAPWWWAVDWSAWAADAASPPPSGGEVPDGGSAEPPLADAEAAVRLSTQELRRWAETLRTEGHRPDVRLGLVQRLDEAACVAIESWSVSLFRTARREARERGLSVDFDIEGGQVRLEAASLQRLMATFEPAIAARVAQGTGAPLRLRAAQHHGGVRLVLDDGHEAPWPEDLDAAMSPLSDWLVQQGGHARRTAGGWVVDLPMTPMQLPVCALVVGPATVWVPALWVAGVSPLEPELSDRVRQAGAIDHEGQTWPVSDLGALVRSERSGIGVAQVVLMQRGGERLGLVVDSMAGLEGVRPLEWTAALKAVSTSTGIWRLAQRLQGSVCALTDPFALQRRFGAAARVLARSKARRGA